MVGYLFGGNTGVKTAAELQREREIVDALIARGGRSETLGEGISTFGRAIADRIRRKRLEKDEAAGKDAGRSLKARLFGQSPDSPTITQEPSLAGSDYNAPEQNVTQTYGPETSPGPADWQQGQPTPSVAVEQAYDPNAQVEDLTQDAYAQAVPQPMPTSQPVSANTANTLENMSPEQIMQVMADPGFGHMEPIVQQFVADALKRKMTPVDPMDALSLEEKRLQIEALRNPAAKAPTVDTFYDEVTGQPIKRQWNPQTGQWENQGGVKADENGITVGPDGTVQIGGPAGKVTEGMRRAKGFKASMKSSIESLQSNFTALTDPKNYLGDVTKAIGGRKFMTPEGQMAADNFDEVVADALYVASGATLTAPEVERKKAAIIPTPSDSPQTIAAKKRRLDDLVHAIDVMAGDPPGSGQPLVDQAAPQASKSPVVINGYTIQEIP